MPRSHKSKWNVRFGRHHIQTMYWRRRTATSAARSIRDRDRGEAVHPFGCPRTQLPHLALVLAMPCGSRTRPVPTWTHDIRLAVKDCFNIFWRTCSSLRTCGGHREYINGFDLKRSCSRTHLICLLNLCEALRRTLDVILVFIGMMDQGEFPECFLQQWCEICKQVT